MYAKNFIIVGLVVLLGQINAIFSQPFPPTKFTWEGAFSGNRAVWKDGDTLNNYTGINGVDVQVRLIDPEHINTTSQQPSEFNDWTKTNTFYGRGNFAFQTISRKKGDHACLEFTFSKPITLDSFKVYDIDMLQSMPDKPYNTYQDSVSFKASSKIGNVPLTLNYLDPNPDFTIYGQSAKANFIAGVNGDLPHTDPRGAVKVHSELPIDTFILCYQLGSEEDGFSNSHSIKITGFDFTELLGEISGNVIDDKTGLPLPGATIRLYDMDGHLVKNKQGIIMQVTTNEDGTYNFPYLPMGQYKIIETDPDDYESSADIDGENDNQIITEIDIVNPQSPGNDFYDIRKGVLAVSIADFTAKWMDQHVIKTEWNVTSEVNCAYYDVMISTDGRHYERAERIYYSPASKHNYQRMIRTSYAEHVYVQLRQSDFDGQTTTLSTVYLPWNTSKNLLKFYPNPVSNLLTIEKAEDVDVNEISLYNTDGKLIRVYNAKDNKIDLSDIAPGIYFMRWSENGTIQQYKIIKL